MSGKLNISRGDPRDPAATRLLDASHALMQSLYCAEACHVLSIDALCVPEVRFFVAKFNGETVGCCALAIKDGYGEVKSMYVDKAARGAGVADRLLETVVGEAQLLKLPMLRLETGEKLTAALRLYQRAGFNRRGAYGDYDEDPSCLFMEKRLA